MYKMSWPDLACASAAMVISALFPVKRSIWTSTFSFAAHSWINASEVLLASGTKWSQKPIESLPAACAVLTNGAAIIVVDAAADVAMNRRRLNIFPLLVFAPFWCQGSKRVRKPAANQAIRSRLILSKLLRRDWQPAPSGPLYANQFVKGRRWQCQMPRRKPTSFIARADLRIVIPCVSFFVMQRLLQATRGRQHSTPVASPVSRC